MQDGKLQIGDEAAPVQYELQTVMVGTLRERKGKLVLLQTPGPALAAAMTKLTGANLVTVESQVHWIEFTEVRNGAEIYFAALPPQPL